VIDHCNVGVKKEPNGGVVFVFTDIVGLEGISLMVPFEGKETAQACCDQIQELIGPRIQADLNDMRRMTHGT
jgi:hypothetical protein